MDSGFRVASAAPFLTRAAILSALCIISLTPLVASGDPPVSDQAAKSEATQSGAVSEALAFKRDAVGRASILARRGDHSAAMDVVREVREKLGEEEPFVDELSGTVEALEKKYAEAETSFRKQLKKTPESQVGRFNLAEMIFLQGRYEEAEHEFAGLEALKREADPALADLCRYKRVVCRLALGKTPEAEALLPADGAAPASPAVQYSRAAVSYARQDFKAAAAAIEDARARFSPDVENLYVDSLIELRWGGRDAEGKFGFVARKTKE